MGLQDAAIQPSRVRFCSALLKNCGRGESLSTATCLRTVVGVSKGMLPVRSFCSNNSSFCVSLIFWRSCGCHNIEVNLATLILRECHRILSSGVCQLIGVANYQIGGLWIYSSKL